MGWFRVPPPREEMPLLRAELRSMNSPDVAGGDPADFAPEDPADFHLLVSLDIGIAGEAGGANFDVVVCSPWWLAREGAERGYRWGRATLVLPRWDHGVFERAITEMVDATRGDTWDEIAMQIGRFTRSEMERWWEQAWRAR